MKWRTDAITRAGAVSAGWFAWRAGGRLHVTLVAKASFGLRAGGPMVRLPAEPLVPAAAAGDAHTWPDDAVPYLAQADVLLLGHARAPRVGATRGRVRLALRGARMKLDKVLDVFGPRTAAGVPGPFEHVELGWQPRLGSPIAGAPTVELPGRHIAGSFGPVSTAAGVAARLGVSDEPIVEIPDGFDWHVLQAAPPDQRAPFLQGDEWLLVEGVTPSRFEMLTQLPAVTVSAWVAIGDEAARRIEMNLDRLLVDGDAEHCAVVGRGAFSVEEATALEHLRLAVGIASAGAPIDWQASVGTAGTPVAARVQTALWVEPGSAAKPHGTSVAAPGAQTALWVEPAPHAKSPAAGAETALWVELDDDDDDDSLAGTIALVQPAASELLAARTDDEEEDPLAGTMALGAGAPVQPATPWEAEGEAEDPLAGTMGLSRDFAAAAATPWATPGAPPPAPRATPQEAKPALPFQPAAGVASGAPGQPSPPAAPPPLGAAPPPPPAPPLTSGPFVVPPPAQPPPPPALAVAADDGEVDLGGTVAGTLVAVATEGAAPFPLAQAAGAAEGAAPFPLARAAAALTPAFVSGAPWCAPDLRAPVPLPSDDPLAGTLGLSQVFADAVGADAEASEADEGAPLLSKRRSKALPIVNASALRAASVVWQLEPGRTSAAVIVKATCALGGGGPAVRVEESEPPTGERFLDDDHDKSVVHPGDFAIVKPRADVTLAGHAHAPGGTTTEMRVRFRFGRQKGGFDRELAVFGPRAWEGEVPGAAAPFERVPLVWERAFGGADHEANPVGTGYVAPDAEDASAPPQLEDPQALCARRGDTPAPAAFSPIAAGWGPRRSLCGTFDDAWRRERWPYFPADFDQGFFQSAPRAQQLPHLVGDEPYELHGMHPEHAVLRGTLPGVRARCFVQHAGAAPRGLPSIEGFRALELVLDGVHFDVDADRIHLVWRGLLPLADAKGRDVESLFVVEEPLRGASLSLAEARARYLALGAKPRPPAELADAAQANDASPPGVAAAELAAAGAERSATLAGLPPAEATPAPPPLAPDGAEAGAGRRAEVVARLREGRPLVGLELDDADLSELDLSGADLARARLARANLARAKLAGADLTQAQLGGANLSDADLTGAVLERADLEAARLERAVLRGARLRRASLERTLAAGADFEGADARGASFAKADLAGARFAAADLGGADMTETRLDEAVFDGAKARELRIYDASATGASLRGAELGDARADGARLLASALDDVRAAGSVWEGAVLEGSTFVGAALSGASLVSAACAGADFSDSKLVGARLDEAGLAGCRLPRANLMRAQLVGADLTGAELAGANLFQAETWNAVLTDANLADAIVAGTKLATKDPTPEEP